MRNEEPKDIVTRERIPGMPLFPKRTLSKKGRTFRKNMTFFLFMLPALIGLILFYIKPFGTVVQFSFVDNAYAKNFAGFKNFSDLFQNASFLRALGNSGFLAVAGTVFLIALSLFIAELMTRAQWFSSALKTILLVPFVMPAACVALVFLLLVDHSEIMLKLFTALGIGSSSGLSNDYALYFVLFLFLWKHTGYFVLLFSGSLINVDQSVVDAARMDGAGNARIFFTIKLRAISPSVLFAVLLSVMSSFGMYREVYLMYGEHPPKTVYLISHFLHNTMLNTNYSKMSAAALIVMLLVILLSVVLIFVERRGGKDLER